MFFQRISQMTVLCSVIFLLSHRKLTWGYVCVFFLMYLSPSPPFPPSLSLFYQEVTFVDNDFEQRGHYFRRFRLLRHLTWQDWTFIELISLIKCPTFPFILIKLVIICPLESILSLNLSSYFCRAQMITITFTWQRSSPGYVQLFKSRKQSILWRTLFYDCPWL